MKFIVAVDLEGVACAYGAYGDSVEKTFNIEFVRMQATREANAAVKALYDCGAEEVIVWDNHGRGCSLEHDNLDERCQIAIGYRGEERYPVLDDSFTGVLLIGYHAKASTGDAAMAHTYSSKDYQSIKINGREFGEVGVDAAIAGLKGVPVIFVSGDDKAVKEAKEFLPWIKTVETKKAFAYTGILSKHPKKAEKEIYETVKKAVEALDEMKCYVVDGPVELEVRYRRTDAAKLTRLVDMYGDYFEYDGAYTRKGRLKSIEEVITRI